MHGLQQAAARDLQRHGGRAHRQGRGNALAGAALPAAAPPQAQAPPSDCAPHSCNSCRRSGTSRLGSCCGASRGTTARSRRWPLLRAPSCCSPRLWMPTSASGQTLAPSCRWGPIGQCAAACVRPACPAQAAPSSLRRPKQQQHPCQGDVRARPAARAGRAPACPPAAAGRRRRSAWARRCSRSAGTASASCCWRDATRLCTSTGWMGRTCSSCGRSSAPGGCWS